MSLSTNGSSHPVVPVLGIPIARVGGAEALTLIEERVSSGSQTLVAYANAHTLNVAVRDETFARVLREADLVLNDGIGVQLAARMRGAAFSENLNGSDFTPRILHLAATHGWKVFLLGAADGVAERAGERLAKLIPRLTVVGAHHGYFDAAQDRAVVETVRASGAKVLLVAMGNPRQELWLAEHLEATGAVLGVGVGAFFDFTVGEQQRAPAWMNRLGIEWLYRLLREPSRMWRRYVLGNPAFLLRAWRTRRADLRRAGSLVNRGHPRT